MSQHVKKTKVVLFKNATLLSAFLRVALYYKNATPIRVSESIAKRLTSIFKKGRHYNGPIIAIYLTEERMVALEKGYLSKEDWKEVVMSEEYTFWFFGIEKNLKRLRKVLVESSIEPGAIVYYSHARQDSVYQVHFGEDNKWEVRPIIEMVNVV